MRRGFVSWWLLFTCTQGEKFFQGAWELWIELPQTFEMVLQICGNTSPNGCPGVLMVRFQPAYMKIEVKKLGATDIDQFVELIRVFEDVFEMENFRMPARDYLQQLLAKDSFFVFVAGSNGRVLGGLTAYVLQQYYSELPQVYIYDLAVKTEYQRQGIGRQLISGITDYSKNNGMDEVFVQADLEDDHAVEFYRATGGTPEQVIHFTYDVNGGE